MFHYVGGSTIRHQLIGANSTASSNSTAHPELYHFIKPLDQVISLH
jgi:hypothetical protein